MTVLIRPVKLLSPAKKAPLVSHTLRPWNDCSSSFHCTGNQDFKNLSYCTHLSSFCVPYRFILWHVFRPSCFVHCNEMASWIYGRVLFYIFKCVIIWSDFVLKWSELELRWSEVKWVTVKFLRTKVPCTIWWLYTEGIWLYYDYFIWNISCAVVVSTCTVMCGYFENFVCALAKCVLGVYCFLYCLYCVLYCLVYV